MSARQWRNALIAAIVLLAVLLGLDISGYLREQRFNALVAANDLLQAGQHPGNRGRFAAAFHAHRAGQLDNALARYATIDAGADPGLQSAVKFNLGNLYLEQSTSIAQSENPDLAIALIELAKESYRAALRLDSDDWDAKHNLARALELLPDPEPLPVDDEDMPERAPRAPQTTRAYERLP